MFHGGFTCMCVVDGGGAASHSQPQQFPWYHRPALLEWSCGTPLKPAKTAHDFVQELARNHPCNLPDSYPAPTPLLSCSLMGCAASTIYIRNESNHTVFARIDREGGNQSDNWWALGQGGSAHILLTCMLPMQQDAPRKRRQQQQHGLPTAHSDSRGEGSRALS